MKYDAEKEWTKTFVGEKIAYPSEYVIRIFKGKYPKLNFDKNSFKNKKICDVGCGDGRNLLLLKQCGFDIYGVELTQDIVNNAKSNLMKAGIVDADIRVGTNDSIQFEDRSFDYLLSWNVCYYMGKNTDFNKHVDEYARILKTSGYLVLSIPKKTCFIYEDSEKLKDGYQIIRNDPFNVRNGELLRMFEGEDEIKEVFSKHFENFVSASIHDDCFGFNYHWHLIICQKKNNMDGDFVETG